MAKVAKKVKGRAGKPAAPRAANKGAGQQARSRRAQEPEAGTQKGFGFRAVNPDERTSLVRDVFESVAPRYDVMNDLMSLGIHRLWKRVFVAAVAPRPEEAILDLAGGTGDIAFLMAEARRKAQGGALPETPVTVCDINPAMLAVGRARAADKGLYRAVNWVEGNAEKLPFDDAQFDVVTIAFGLRNVTHLSKALGEMRRVLRKGGRFYCLEFSHVALPWLKEAYDRYSFTLLPWLGEKVAGDRAAYQYLAESIRAFPQQEALCALMREAGLQNVNYRNLNFGIAAIHSGVKG